MSDERTRTSYAIEIFCYGLILLGILLVSGCRDDSLDWPADESAPTERITDEPGIHPGSTDAAAASPDTHFVPWPPASDNAAAGNAPDSERAGCAGGDCSNSNNPQPARRGLFGRRR